jgi:polyisoprenyl-phosphate glycosyltransferase
MDISIVIPVYKGDTILIPLFKKIKQTLESTYEFEVLFIEDSGVNANIHGIKTLICENPGLAKGYILKKNYGQHKALLFGFGKASGNFIITMDEDMQHNPEDILKLLNEQALGNFDVVYGRFINSEHKIIRRLFSQGFRIIITILQPSIYFNYSPYRLIKKSVADKAVKLVSPYVFVDDYLSQITRSFSFVNVHHHKRYSGKSSYTFSKFFFNGILIILTYSRITSWLLFCSGILFAWSIAYYTKSGILLFSNSNSENKNFFISIIVFGFIFTISGLSGIFLRNLNRKNNAIPIMYYEVK